MRLHVKIKECDYFPADWEGRKSAVVIKPKSESMVTRVGDSDDWVKRWIDPMRLKSAC